MYAQGRELREGRRQHLHGIQLQRFHFFIILEEFAIRVNIYSDFATCELLGNLFKVRRCQAFWGVGRCYMTKFDDNLRYRILLITIEYKNNQKKVSKR